MKQEIKQRIEQLSREKKQEEIVEFLKAKLKNDQVSAQEIYDYAESYYWESKAVNKNYVITAQTVNLLGVMVSSLKLDPTYAKMLYKLAADRGSNWGFRNYAFEISKKDAKEALVYMQKAIDLSGKEEKQELQLCYSKILWLNDSPLQANTALGDYLNYKTRLYYQNNSKDQDDIKAAVKVCQERLDIYLKAINQGIDLTQCESYSAELAPFLEGSVIFLSLYAPALSIAAYLKGYLHEQLSQSAQAMQAYAKVTDTKHSWYGEAVAARERLLREEVNSQLQPIDVGQLSAAVEDLTITAKTEAIQELDAKKSNALPSMWQKEGDYFDFVDIAERDRLLEEKNAPHRASVHEKYELLKTLEEQLKSQKGKDARSELKAQISQLEEDIRTIQQRYCRELDSHKPEKREILRRHLAERRFFNPKRTRKKSSLTELTGKIVGQRYNHANNNSLDPLALTDISTRHFITAEAAFQASVSSLMEVAKQFNFANLGLPIVTRKPWTCGRGENLFGPLEHYQVRDTVITAEHRANPKTQRLGDSYLPQHGTYNKIFAFLNRLTGGDADKEKTLAGYMIRYGQKHQAIILEELQALNPHAQEQDVDEFNRVCFLIMEKEQGQWHSATSESFQLGMAVSQARCLILLKEGVLRFAEVFKNNAPYGVYSQTGMINSPDAVAQACKEVDSCYKAYLLAKQPASVSNFFKPSSEASKPPYMVLSRKQARADLLQVYGGESDTDGEGYESDISISSRI